LASTRAQRAVTVIVGGLLVGLVILAATLAVRQPSGYKRPGASVILISIDTLRADHLGCYGYEVETSPAVDRFARDAVLFEMPIAQAPSTEPSHASIFTSLIPSHHGAYFSRKVPLSDELVTMAEIFQQHGYRTKSFNDGAQVSAKWGFDQGFDEYTTLPGPPTEYKFRRTVKEALGWLTAHRDDRFFLFLHTYEPHHPYSPAPRYFELIGHEYRGALPREISKRLLERLNRDLAALSAEDVRHVVAAYDAEIRSMDEAFDDLLRGLDDLGLREDVLIVFTSDHGEELGERERIGWHSHALFDEQIHVPLIISLPRSRIRGVRVASQVRSIDILPTVLDVVDIAPLEVFEGQTLIPFLDQGGGGPLPAVSQRDVFEPRGPVSLRTGRWKYYDRSLIRRRLLFDVGDDPGELRDLSREDPERVIELRRELEQLLGQRPTAPRGEPVEIDAALKRKLEALGYIKE
jgi:arylsulfatase A-like enzyme